MKKISHLLLFILFPFCCCTRNDSGLGDQGNSVYIDKPYLQDYSIKYYCPDPETELKKAFSDRNAILDHWEAERPEKEGLWNIMTALTGEKDTDLDEAIWYLQEYPLDMVEWDLKNSHRKDIEKIEPNFRGQTISEILPPDELVISRHNANRFDLDGGNGGRSELSAGDIWLLP